MSQVCIHPQAAMYEWTDALIGELKLCWDCRRELVIRTHAYKEIGMLRVDGGRIGYECGRCKGQFTSTDAGTCKCPGRKEDCANERRAQDAWNEYAKLTIWKPKKV